jgi:hypothetical protein
MKKTILFIAFITCAFIESSSAKYSDLELSFHLGVGFFSWNGEKIIKVAELPEFYKNKEGKHVDIGYRYQQFKICFIPIWNYNESWCGYIEGDTDYYINWSKSKVSDIAKKNNITLPVNSPIDFYDNYGGKLLFAAIIIVLVFYEILKNQRKEINDLKAKIK